MGRKSQWDDVIQKNTVTLIISGKYTINEVTDMIIGEKPSERTVKRWIETWKSIIEAEQEAEQIEADIKRQKEAEKGHNRHNSEKGRHKKKKTIEIDLRDLKDGFVLYVNELNPDEFTTPRNSTIKRIQTQKRYGFTHGTIDLLTQYLKFKKLKVIKIG